jgi:hypothetical protein
MMAASPCIGDDRLEPMASGDDELYGGALAALLTQAVQRPSVLGRLQSALRKLHSRRRDDGEPLPPEHWFQTM